MVPPVIEPSLELQRAIRASLVDTIAITDLVTPNAIRDGAARPDLFPSIIFGASQTVIERVTYSRKHVRVFQDLHVWTKEAGMVAAKTIAAAVLNALAVAPALAGFSLLDHQVDSVRYMRDPGGEHGHAVITVSALIEAVE